MKKFSIITPTFNSSSTLCMYFDSILMQNYDLSKIEILIIDGGSLDDTCKIARSFGEKIDVRIINNPHRLPEYAKTLGVNEACGEYCVFQDSDEILVNSDSFKIREEVFAKCQNVQNIVCTTMKNPIGYSPWGEYTSLIGDPFSSFLYNFNADSNLQRSKRNYKCITETKEYCVFMVSDKDLQPLIDATSHTFNKAYLLKVLGKSILVSKDSTLVSQLITSNAHCFAVTKNDEVLHYSSSSFMKIIMKIRTRIIRNVFGDEDAGFMARMETIPAFYKKKRYLFMVYAFLIIPPIYDGVKYSYKTKNIYMLSHCIFTIYTALGIIYYLAIKSFGIVKRNEKYG